MNRREELLIIVMLVAAVLLGAWSTRSSVRAQQEPAKHLEGHAHGTFARHAIDVGEGLEIELPGVSENSDWLLGVKVGGTAAAAFVAEVQHDPTCAHCGSTGFKDWDNITPTHGKIVVPGAGAMAATSTLMLYVEVPEGTRLTVRGDGGTLYSAAASDSIVRQGKVVSQTVAGLGSVLAALQTHTGPQMTPSPKGDGKYIVTNEMLHQHALSTPMPTGATSDGKLFVQMLINKQGHVVNVSVSMGNPALESLTREALLNWTFTPFETAGQPQVVLVGTWIEFAKGQAIWH